MRASWTRRFGLGLLTFFSAFSSRGAEAPAHWRFVTLKSPHFELIVNATQQELGHLYLRKFETSRLLLKPLFSDLPEKTIVVIMDRTDATNGYATQLPYPHIFLYPVLPGAQDSLADTGDWMLELAAHEYTHILSFEAVSSVMESLQSIFGTILSPNLLLPRWWKEGVAVHVETQVSAGGRLRSSYQDALIRSWSQTGRLKEFNLAEINEILPDWPRGMRPYVFGSIFWSEAIEEKGSLVVDRLHQHHGGRVPYFVEAPAREHLGAGYNAFYQAALSEADRRAQEQIAALEKQAPTPLSVLQLDLETSSHPRVSPDGQHLALIGVDETDRRAVLIYERSEEGDFLRPRLRRQAPSLREDLPVTPNADGPPTGSIHRVSWFPDGQRLVFDKIEAVSRQESYSDLWIYDLQSRQAKKWTRAARLREPDVSPAGQKIAAVALNGAKTGLQILQSPSGESRRAWEADWQERISFPTWLDESRLVFSLRKSDGTESLWLWTEGDKQPQPILADFPGARLPERLGQGLLFVSNRNGVQNLYVADADLKNAQPLSHVITSLGSSGPDPRTGDLYTTWLSPDGPQVAKIEKPQALQTALPQVSPLYADRFPSAAEKVAEAEAEAEKMPIDTEDYRSGSYLWPRYWFPIFGLSAVNNSLIFQASTSGHDPLKKHSYEFGVGWDEGVKRGSFAAAYRNAVTSHPVVLQAAQTQSYLISIDNPISTTTAALSMLPDLFHWNRYLSLDFGLRGVRTDTLTNSASRAGPALALQYFNYARSGWQISPEEGGQAYAGVAHYVPGQNRLSYTQSFAGGKYFWSRGLPARHALALRLDGVSVADSLGAIYGSSTTNTFFQADSPLPNFVMRGYRVGHFFGKSLANFTGEYRFPLKEIRRGHGTDPLFLTRLHGAVFVDGLQIDGFAYNPKRAVFEAVKASEKSFWSYGAEARLETTLGYFLPLNLVLGFAVPTDSTSGEGANVGLSLQMGTLF